MNALRLRFTLLCFAALTGILTACSLDYGAAATMPPPEATAQESLRLTVVWVEGGDLYLWREDDPTPQVIAESGVITPYLSPDGAHVAFTRGAQGEPSTLWVVATDGTEARELVTAGDVPARGQGRPEIGDVAWFDDAAIYFSSRQRAENGIVDDENLYRVEIDGEPQLILPPGAGGDFTFSPDRQWIAIANAGGFTSDDGRISLLDPLGARVREVMTFPKTTPPEEPPITPLLAWSADSSFIRVPLTEPNRTRVTLWRIPVPASDATAEAVAPPATPADAPAIFGTVGALPEGLPRWGRENMIYLQESDRGTALLIANPNGENARVYLAGRISDARWLPDGDHFVFTLGAALVIGAPGVSPQLLFNQPPGAITFLRTGAFVYSDAGELRYGALASDGVQSQMIAQVGANTAFDAVLVP